MLTRIFDRPQLFFCFRSFSKEASASKGVNNLEREAVKILHQQLKSRKQDFILTTDRYRVDIGYIVCRLPIFYDIPQEKLEVMKIRYDFYEKHNRHMILHKDFLNKARQARERGGPAEPDNATATHEYKDANGDPVTYSTNSKYFKSVDPNIMNDKSVQYCPTQSIYLVYKDLEGNWGFPSLKIKTNERVQEARDRVMSDISRNTVKVHWRSSAPVHVEVVNFPASEIRNSRDPVGKKIFYYEGIHTTGNCDFDPELYQDCVWAPKSKMNRYLDRNTFEKFVHLLSHY